MGRAKKPDILPPMEGISYLMDEMYMSNADPRSGKFPDGEPVEFYLFIERFIRKQKKRIVHEIHAATEELALEQLREFASRPDVILVEEKTRKPAPKDWLKEDKDEET